jgi:zinc transport system permease protein
MTFIRLFWPALIAAAVVGAAAPAIGTFLVQRRLSLIGDGVGHISLAGVAIGLWLKISPLASALGFAILGAIGIDRLRRRAPEESDMALALFFYGSIAIAVVVASASGQFNVNLFGFLFGQVLTVSHAELITIGALGAAVIALVSLLYRGLLASAIDEEAATVAGVPVSVLNIVLMVLGAVTVGVGMQVVGVLLVAALLVLPVGIARNLVRSFKGTMLVASGVGASSALAGLFISNAANTAPSGTIVLVVSGLFVLTDAFRRARLAVARREIQEPQHA